MVNKSTWIKLISISHWLLFVSVGLYLVYGSDYFYMDLQFRFIAIVSILLTASYVSWLFYDQRTGLLLLQFWIFNSIFFVLVPIAVVSNQSFWFVNNALDRNFKISIFYGVLGLLFISFLGSEIKLHPLRSNRIRYELDVNRFRIIVVAYFVVFLYLIVFQKKIVNNALRYYGSSQGFSSVSTVENGLSKVFFVAMPMLFVLFLLRLSNSFSHLNRNLFFVIFLSILVAFANPLGNSRQVILLAFLPIVLAFFNGRFALHRFFILLIVFLIIFGHQISYAISHSAENIRNFGISRIFESYSFDPNKILVKGDFDSFAMFATGIKYIGLEGFVFPFFQFLGVLFFFVPRSIWSGKPQDTAVEVANLAGFEFQNLSSPWLLELLANGGLVLVILGAFLVPRALKHIDRTSSFDDFGWLMGYLLIGSEYILLRGSMLQAAGVFIFGLIMARLLVKRVR